MMKKMFALGSSGLHTMMAATIHQIFARLEL
jgi:hypothetical protein